MSNTTAPSPGDSTTSRPLLSPYYRNRILVISASVLCFCAFWWAGRLTGIPRHPGYEANLFQQPSPGAAVLVTALVLIGCALAGSLIARSVQPEAGLLAACAGLSAVSIRGGTLHDVLFYAQSPTVYWAMAAELIVLLALVVLAWQVSDRILARPAAETEGAARRIPPADLALATASQFVFTSALLIALAQSDAKRQVLAAVGLAGFSAALITYYLFRVQYSACYWCGTILAGLLGYAMTYLRPIGWEIGEAQAPLLSAAPAVIFVAALAVYEWFMRRWMRETRGARKPRKTAGRSEGPIGATARSIGWLCIAPVLVFLVAANWLFMDSSQNLLAPLARPLPLDYASAGPVGAILGLWAAREWAESDEDAGAGDGPDGH